MGTYSVSLCVCVKPRVTLSHLLSLNLPLSLSPAGAEDRRGRVRRDLRGAGPGDSGTGRPQARVGQAAQAGSQDGGGRAQETPRWVLTGY